MNFNACLDFAPKASAKSPHKSPAKAKKPAGQTTLSFSKPVMSHDTKPHPHDENDDMEVEQSSSDVSNRDNSFRQFRRLCEDLEKEPSYNAKTKLVSNYIKYGNSGGEYIVHLCMYMCIL